MFFSDSGATKLEECGSPGRASILREPTESTLATALRSLRRRRGGPFGPFGPVGFRARSGGAGSGQIGTQETSELEVLGLFGQDILRLKHQETAGTQGNSRETKL